jgi:hypothetical protein
MAGTPKNSGTWAGSGTVRGYNLQNSLGKVDIAGLYNSMSDPSGVLTRQAQDAAVVNQIINSLEAENAEAAKANTGGPKTDFPGTNRDLTSDSIGGYAVDLGSVYSLFPDAATSAVTAAMQNDYLNSLLGTGQYKGLSAAEQLDLFTKLQATNAPRFISSEEGIRPATEQETADFYDDIVDYLLGLGSVPKTTEDAVIEGTLGESKGEEIDRFFGNNAETDASIVEKIQEQVRRIGSAVGKAQDTVFDLLGIPKPDYSVIQPNAPGGTVIWGQPSGGVFGRIGTTPGGTVTGVQTGIPALDILLGKVADVASGRATTGDVLNTQTIQDIMADTALTRTPALDTSKSTSEAPTVDRVASLIAGDGGDTTDLSLDRVASLLAGDSTGTDLSLDRVASLLAGDSTDTDLSLDRVASLTAGAGGDTDLSLDRVLNLPTDRTVGNAPSLEGALNLTTDRVIGATPTVDRVASLIAGDGGDTTDLSLDRALSLTTDRTIGTTPTVDRVASLIAGDGGDTTDLSLDRALSLTTDRTIGTTPSLDRALSLTTDRTTGTTPNLDRAPTLTTDRTGTLDPTLTERAPTLSSTSDRADEVPDGGSVGGVGLGEEGGVRIVSGAPGDVVDIDYLFDIGGESIFAPTLEDEDEEEDKYRPYVYAKSGGMINTYDPVDDLIRLLNQRY